MADIQSVSGYAADTLYEGVYDKKGAARKPQKEAAAPDLQSVKNDVKADGVSIAISPESQDFLAGAAERKAIQQEEQDKLMEQYDSNPFAYSGNAISLVNLATGEKVNKEPSQWQVFSQNLRQHGFYDNMSDEGIKKTEDLLKGITYRTDSIHDLTDYDRHLSDLTHEAAKLEFFSSLSALHYFADTYLTGDARDSFKSLIKDYEDYNSASVAKHKNWSDLYSDSMKNVGAPNADRVREAVQKAQERTKASQEIGRVTHTKEDEAKLYQDYKEIFDRLAGGEEDVSSIFDEMKNTLIDYASGGSKNSAVLELLQSQNTNSFNNIVHYWSKLLKS